MEERDAQDVVRMVEAAWGYDYGEKGRKLWREMLLPFDAELATKALAKLSERQRERPTIADLRQMILIERRDQIVALGEKAEIPPRYATPEWVYVWWWCRRMRAPRNLIAFPQQKGFADETNMLTDSEYEGLRQEWKQAGAPKTDVAAALATGTFSNTPRYVDNTIAVLQTVADE